MSLAIYAAPFDNESDNLIKRKKMMHNRTQKRFPSSDIDNEKVNSVLEKIHNSDGQEGSEEDGLADYYTNPPPKPESIGSSRAEFKEGMQNNNHLNTLGVVPVPDEDLELNNYNSNYANEQETHEYYKKFVPNFTAQMMHDTPNKDEINKMHYTFPPGRSPQDQTFQNMGFTGGNDIMIQKLNYMINLLEEKQDERTNNVTEEVVLYSFLGIFIIFVVDSFARVGRYTRT